MSSIIFGVLASILPNLLSVWLYSMRDGLSVAHLKFLRFFYLIEVLKFAGVAFLFSVFLKWPHLSTIKFFSAFLLSEMARLFYNFYKFTETKQ